MRSFKPDLIVEVTSACNRSCTGCYAPNVVSNKSAQELLSEKPELFLDVKALERQIMFWEHETPSTLSVRGGEPTLHPDLSGILNALRFFSKEVVIETHGRWLLSEQRADYESLLSAIVSTGSVVKVSFDSMHRLKPEQLKEMKDFLLTLGIKFLVAITEKSTDEFNHARSLIPWIDENSIIFQIKAENADSLVKPGLGVIGVNGLLKSSLNSKFQGTIDLKAVVG